MKILIIEDEPGIVEVLSGFLAADGHEIIAADTGEAGLERFAADNPDLVLLDVMLPGIDGWEVLRRIREESDRPVILITALGRTDDRVKGLSLGADDFIGKPFAWEEVRARIGAVMRRYRPVPPPFEINDEAKEVLVGGRTVQLSRKEYRLLSLLASAPGRVFSHKEIISRLWRPDAHATAQDVQKYIYLLRRKLEDDPSNPKLIITVRGFGYRLANPRR